jgi:epoxyqueuosine reductase
MKPKLLFHVCCAPCSGLLSRQLRQDFDVIVYYDNSNIWPEEEFSKRAIEAEKFFQSEGVEFIPVKWNHDDWQKLTSGLEQEPEKGQRCKLCYHYRLKNTVEYAAQNGFEYFTTSLSISPHKDQRAIINFGQALAKQYNLEFLSQDFRAEDGFKKSVDFGKDQNFYRQKYCGCEYSLKNGKI